MAFLPLLQADLNTSPKMNQRADQLKSELAEATDVILLERHNACSQRNPVVRKPDAAVSQSRRRCLSALHIARQCELSSWKL